MSILKSFAFMNILAFISIFFALFMLPSGFFYNVNIFILFLNFDFISFLIFVQCFVFLFSVLSFLPNFLIRLNVNCQLFVGLFLFLLNLFSIIVLPLTILDMIILS